MAHLTRRSLLRSAAVAGAGVALSSRLAGSAWADSSPVPLPTTGSGLPGTRPDSALPAGTPNTDLPFEHVVVVMQENHSFDNYFGMLAKRGQPLADGFTFAPGTTTPVDENPHDARWQRVFRNEGTCQPGSVSQGWDSSHTQVAGGRMNGFSQSWPAAMGYWDQADIPYYYDLATTFCVGNRSFCSVLGQTYPNRRFLYAGTASGMVSTSSDTFTTVPYPSSGTLWDVLSESGVSWTSYFTDLPVVGIIPQTVENYPTHFATIGRFFADCAAGDLPAVSFVDTEAGVADEVGGELSAYYTVAGRLPADFPTEGAAAIRTAGQQTRADNGDEEDPADIALGEASVAAVIGAVMKNPALWAKTLIVWTYDEHGGYYDHVAPPKTVNPDSVLPNSTNQYDQYQTMGVRIPTVVVSPWSRANSVSNVAHDHTAVLETIRRKWNLPALSQRQLTSPGLFDYLDFDKAEFSTPPTLARPALPAALLGDCETDPPAYVYDAQPASSDPAAALPDSRLPVLLPTAGLAGAALLAVRRWNARQQHTSTVALHARHGIAPPVEPAILTQTPADHRAGKGNE